MDIDESIYKFCLKNAFEHTGTATQGAIIGKLINENATVKNKMKEVAPKIVEAIKKVNSMSLEEQKKELKKKFPELLEIERKEKKLVLPLLPNTEDGKVITAFPPEPSGMAHIGHAKAAVVNYLYAKEHEGTFLIRFDDSNPELVEKEYYQKQEEDYKWLGLEWKGKIKIVSNDMEKFYEYAEKLIKDGNFYACTCNAEKIHKDRAEMLDCKCRSNSIEDNLAMWNKMKNGGLDEGSAIIRFKGDMKHKNAVMRDPAMFRIIKGKHPIQGTKYSLWPMYDFESPVEDGLMGVTHRIRSKEFEMRTELQEKIQELLGFKKTIIAHQARFNLKDAIASKRKIREGIEKGELSGWDDPRLVTIAALRKRGFTPEGLRNFILRMGISKTEANIDWSMLDAENRKIIDPIANHYFFVADPIPIEIPSLTGIATIDKNAKNQNSGMRKIKVDGGVFIAKSDLDNIKNGEKIRLKDLANIIFENKSKLNAKFVEETGMVDKKIQWVAYDSIEIKLIMNDNSITTGLAENDLANEPADAHVQLERVGFFRVDKPGKTLYFTHK